MALSYSSVLTVCHLSALSSDPGVQQSSDIGVCGGWGGSPVPTTALNLHILRRDNTLCLEKLTLLLNPGELNCSQWKMSGVKSPTCRSKPLKMPKYEYLDWAWGVISFIDSLMYMLFLFSAGVRTSIQGEVYECQPMVYHTYQPATV